MIQFNIIDYYHIDKYEKHKNRDSPADTHNENILNATTNDREREGDSERE